MPRISVTVPDELTARLEPVKDSVSVSQVCRDALERRITAVERAAKNKRDDLDVADLVERLRDEREQMEGKFEQLGRNNAAAWIGKSSYLELKSVAENHDGSSIEDYMLPRAAFRAMKRDMEAAKADCEGVPAALYKGAWLGYVKQVWGEIADQIGAGSGSNHSEA